MNSEEEKSSPAKSLLKASPTHIPRFVSYKAIAFLLLWYLFSVATLFLNKYILSYMEGDPTVLTSTQLFVCAVCGYVQLECSTGFSKAAKFEKNTAFYRNLFCIGCLRFITLFLGLVALSFIPVSFAETVKSTAPVFTVVFSYFMLGEKTNLSVLSSLVPVMTGLALCSANEISFNANGFIAAMTTNISECLQNVASKKLISSEKITYSPLDVQFYTSLFSLCIQVPVFVLMMNLDYLHVKLDVTMIILLTINGLSFHIQSLSEYWYLSYVSPVTHSVSNTLKRALMIFLSILIFKNTITVLSGIGSIVVIAGVMLYIHFKSRSFNVQQVRPIKIVHRI